VSRTVDDKVVAMSFENHKFESGVRSTISSIDKLKAALHFGNAGKGLAGLSAAANRTDLSHISRGVDEIKGKFGALRIAAIAAMASIAARAANVGVNLVKSFTVTPVLDGLHEYENQLNAVQTILGNTKDAGTNLQDVNKALAQLNKYADQTIYNFGQMTKNVGTFTAAGVDLKTSVASIKGISNLAALSGSSAEQASTAMYQLSQAISAGRVGLQDWNSVVNAGMGGAVFQKSLLRTAENMGALKDGAVEIDKATGKATVNGQSFRESIMAKPGEKSWLTGDVLTNTLKQLSGDMTDAQLKAEGFSDAQIKAIQAQSKMALDAATKVKTLSQLLDTTKEAIGSGWATTFQILLGDFGEAKHLFTGLSTAIGGFVKTSANARNSVLKHWKNLGGRTLLISSLKQAFKDLVAVVTPIREAFRDIFPKKTARDLLASTKNFQRLTETLKPSAETVENLRRTFRGLFAAFDIGKQIIGGIFTALGHMLGAAGDGAGNILSLTGNVGDLIVKLDDWLSQGDKIHTFFAGLGDILSIPIHLIGTLTDKLNGLFSGGGDVAGGLTSSLGGMAEALKPGTKAINAANGAWNTFLETLNKIKNALKPVVDEIVNTFSELGDAIASGLEDGGFEKVFQVIQTGLIAGIFLTIKKGLAGGVNVDLGGGALKNVSKSLNVLKGSLVDIQKNIQAHTLLLIASAVAVLTVSVVALSLIKPDKLAKAMTAISVGMGQLVAALAILNKAVGTGGFARLPFVAASLILLAASIDVLAVAVTIFSKLSWEDLAKGLVGVGGALLIVTAGAQGLSRVGPQMALASVGLIAMGVALTILGGAVKIFSTMSWGDMIKGLAGVVLVLDGVALASRGISPQLLLIGPGIIALGIGLNILAGAVKIFGSMDMATLGKGLGAVAVALIAIGAATWLLPPHLPLTAAGLILVGIALTGIAGAVALMGNMDMSTLAKGIGGIAAALAVLAIGLTAMIASLPGAAALIVAAGALAILVPVIGALGKMKLSTIARGLGAVVVTMIAIALAGAVAAPGLIALGAALAILGVGLALTAGSVYILAKALVLLGDKGGKGIALMIASLTALVAILPKVIIQFVKGMVEVLAQVALIAPKVVDSVVKIIESLLEVVIRASPRMAKAAIALISAILKVFAAKAPAIIEAGWKLLLAFLKGIDNHITEVTKRGIDIALKFLKALAGKIPAIVTAGANILAALLKGIAKNIGKVVVAAGDIIIKLAGGLVKNLGRLVTAGVSILGKIISTITNNLGKILTLGTTIVVRLVKGIGNAAGRIATAAIGAATHFVNVMAREIPKHVDQMATAVIKMINRMAAVVRKREPEFIKAVGNLGIAIVEGIVAGMGGLGEAILKKIKDEITSLPGKGAKLIKKALSKVSVALPLPDGLVRKFGVTLTLMTAGFAGEFEDNFQKALVKIGGATNIETLHNLGNDLSTSFMDGLLSGIDRAAIDPIQQAGSDIVSRFNPIKQTLKTQS
jgi:tape measure domain-containing protein